MNNHVKFKSNRAQVIFDSLIEAGIQVQVISKRFKVLRVTHLGQNILIKGTSFPVNSQPSCIIANNKYLTKKILKSENILTPESYLAQTSRQARLIIINKNLFPCVLKPSTGAHGNKVYANIETLQELDAIMPDIFPVKGKKDVLIEEFVSGSDYRVLVVGNKISAIMERIPAHVIGDGVSSLRQLITKFNKNPLVGKKYEKPMCKILLNGEVKRNLKKKGLNLGYIPENNQQVMLRQNANISTGGIGMDATKEAPEIVKNTAIQAAKAIGIEITGVDIIYNKLSQKAYVLELNDQPGIDIHHYPVIGQAQNVALDIINYLFNAQISKSQLASIESKSEITNLRQNPWDGAEKLDTEKFSIEKPVELLKKELNS